MDGLDYDQMSALDAVCYGWIGDMEDSGFVLGETYHFSLYDGVDKKTWNPQMISSFGYFDASMAMTKDTYEKMGWKGVTNYNLWIDCDKRMWKQLELRWRNCWRKWSMWRWTVIKISSRLQNMLCVY